MSRAAERDRGIGGAMITFYRTTEDAGDQEIQEALQELCLAHEVVLVTASGAGGRDLPKGTRPPSSSMMARCIRTGTPFMPTWRN